MPPRRLSPPAAPAPTPTSTPARRPTRASLSTAVRTAPARTSSTASTARSASWAGAPRRARQTSATRARPRGLRQRPVLLAARVLLQLRRGRGRRRLRVRRRLHSGPALHLPGLRGKLRRGGHGDLGAACSAQSDCVAGLFCSSGATAPRAPASRTRWPSRSTPARAARTTARCESTSRSRARARRPKDFFRLPYPNDIRVTPTASGEQLDISDFPTPGIGIDDVDLVALYKDALTADFDGFSTIAPVTFRFSASINFSSLDSTIHILDLTEPSGSGSSSTIHVRHQREPLQLPEPAHRRRERDHAAQGRPHLRGAPHLRHHRRSATPSSPTPISAPSSRPPPRRMRTCSTRTTPSPRCAATSPTPTTRSRPRA